jgi:hypothetical protein
MEVSPLEQRPRLCAGSLGDPKRVERPSKALSVGLGPPPKFPTLAGASPKDNPHRSDFFRAIGLSRTSQTPPSSFDSACRTDSERDPARRRQTCVRRARARCSSRGSCSSRTLCHRSSRRTGPSRPSRIRTSQSSRSWTIRPGGPRRSRSTGARYRPSTYMRRPSRVPGVVHGARRGQGGWPRGVGQLGPPDGPRESARVALSAGDPPPTMDGNLAPACTLHATFTRSTGADPPPRTTPSTGLTYRPSTEPGPR